MNFFFYYIYSLHSDRVDDDIKRALMDFSYYLTIGDMDLAYVNVLFK